MSTVRYTHLSAASMNRSSSPVWAPRPYRGTSRPPAGPGRLVVLGWVEMALGQLDGAKHTADVFGEFIEVEVQSDRRHGPRIRSISALNSLPASRSRPYTQAPRLAPSPLRTREMLVIELHGITNSRVLLSCGWVPLFVPVRTQCTQAHRCDRSRRHDSTAIADSRQGGTTATAALTPLDTEVDRQVSRGTRGDPRSLMSRRSVRDNGSVSSRDSNQAGQPVLGVSWSGATVFQSLLLLRVPSIQRPNLPEPESHRPDRRGLRSTLLQCCRDRAGSRGGRNGVPAWADRPVERFAGHDRISMRLEIRRPVDVGRFRQRCTGIS